MSVDKVREWADEVIKGRSVLYNDASGHPAYKPNHPRVATDMAYYYCLAYSAYLRGPLTTGSRGLDYLQFVLPAIQAWHEVMRGD